MAFKLTADHLNWVKSLAAVVVIVGVSVGFAGDLRWVSHTKFDLAASSASQALAQLEINQLDRQITFLRTKVRVGEATNSEKIILPELERQLRELQSANP